ncbi:MAG: dioxygenase, partial [Alphaproteobacteria bacterium]|nr:dioxygenase [Alphaproteobacteria bacterium]
MHSFVREIELTNEEWTNAMDLFLHAAQITGPNRGEFIIFANTLGVSALVDLLDVNKKGIQLSSFQMSLVLQSLAHTRLGFAGAMSEIVIGS